MWHEQRCKRVTFDTFLCKHRILLFLPEDLGLYTLQTKRKTLERVGVLQAEEQGWDSCVPFESEHAAIAELPKICKNRCNDSYATGLFVFLRKLWKLCSNEIIVFHCSEKV